MAIAVLLAFAAYSEIQPIVTYGGSVVTVIDLEYAEDLIINEGSSLRRSWVTLNDTECPLTIVEVAFPILQERRRFNLRAEGWMKPRVPISAFEIKVLLFDVFGRPMDSFSTTVIKDFDAGVRVRLWASGPEMRLGQVGELLTAMVLVANVRMQDGAVWQQSEGEIANSILRLGIAPAGEGADTPPRATRPTEQQALGEDVPAQDDRTLSEDVREGHE